MNASFLLIVCVIRQDISAAQDQTDPNSFAGYNERPLWELPYRLVEDPSRRRGEQIAKRLHDQTMFERVAGEVRGRFEMKFFHDAGSVRTDTFDAQRQFLGNVRDGFSVGDQTQNLEFAVG